MLLDTVVTVLAASGAGHTLDLAAAAGVARPPRLDQARRKRNLALVAHGVQSLRAPRGYIWPDP